METNKTPGITISQNVTVAMEIVDVLPPPNHEDAHVVIMAVAYMLLFVLGTCGNVAVLTTIMHLLRSKTTTLDNTLLYIIVLSCVDFGVCLSLPFTVIDQILGFWMFGSVLCKLHAVFENFGKILSALILTAMAFDRYAGVCISRNKVLRSRTVSIYIMLGLVLYATLTLCPLLLSFDTREIILFEKENAHRKTRMKIEKCTMQDVSSAYFTSFTIFQFFLCFIVPLCLVTFFYTKLLMALRRHARNFKSSHIPLMRISLYTFAVACFYFTCWTPFWVATIYAVYLENRGAIEGNDISSWFVYCMYFIHALPFTNSAINWILYGALNSQLQQKSNQPMDNSTKTTKVTCTPIDNRTFNGHVTNTVVDMKTVSGEEAELLAVRIVSSNSPALL